MAPTIGQTLRAARAERGEELSDVEVATKIRVKFLEAMEGDRWDELPAPVYARGFLEIYARHLGLDQGALLRRYRETVERDRAEPIPESVIKPGTLRQTRPVHGARSIPLGSIAKVVGAVAVVVIIALVVAGALGGSDDNNGGAKENRAAGGAGGPHATVTRATTTTPSDRVSVELRATAPVWVCLVDDSGRALVDSETLGADEDRGPFDAAGFEVTLGNGSVELSVDGQAQRVPPLAEPLGYRITPSGIRRLDPGSGPTCA
jgi:cytoskeleton protein RodZ